MEDSLLSIKETAQLMGVCENSLRDWDIEGKFKALRTIGGHRRYSLDQIREYLNKNDVIKEIKKSYNDLELDISIKQNNVKQVVDAWKKTEYLIDIPEDEQANLATLLKTCHDYCSIADNLSLSTSQYLWLITEAWKRMQFKKMIAIQAMSLNVNFGFYQTINSKESMCINSDPVAARTDCYDFVLFKDANFDLVKDLYANAIASELDMMIFKKIYENNTIKISMEDIRDNLIDFEKIKDLDYFVGPSVITNKIKSKLKNIDVYEIMPMLDHETFQYMFIAGNYVKHNILKPCFMPYMLFTEAAHYMTATKKVLHRIGWLN